MFARVGRVLRRTATDRESDSLTLAAPGVPGPPGSAIVKGGSCTPCAAFSFGGFPGVSFSHQFPHFSPGSSMPLAINVRHVWSALRMPASPAESPRQDFPTWPRRRTVLLLLSGAGLFSPELPAQEPPAPAAYLDYAVRRDGNVERGRQIFLSAGKAGCSLCHTIDGKGGKAGPDLFAVGDTFPRRELIAAILEPSATIAVGYGATSVQTRSDVVFYGIIKQATREMTELIGVDGRTFRIPTAEIAAQYPSPISLMPRGLQNSLSLQEFTDLVEFLVSLKQPGNSLTSNRGMPDDIPELAKPVVLRPAFPEALRFPSSVVQKPGDIRSGLVFYVQVPGEPNAFLAVHESGRIWRLDGKSPDQRKTLFADFSAEVYAERGPNGLLGLAFHPKFRENRKYYLKHQVMEEGTIATTLVEKLAAADFRTDSGTPSRRLLKIACVTQNHTGGTIAFGPDGYLYLGMGDTGPQQDPNGHGQDTTLLLGKMLRLDVDHRDPGFPYAIPSDNPFRGQPGFRPEIWAYGFREPWRFAFDRETGDLWVGDVGQDRVEEVSIVRRGENYGWNVYEGFEPFSNLRRKEGAAYVPPVVAYRRRYGNSVTGGYVYRGDKASSFYGVYVFGDYTSRQIWGLTQKDRQLQSIVRIGTSPEGIAAFATDEQGRIYVVGYEGMVYEIDFSATRFEAPPLPSLR